MPTLEEKVDEILRILKAQGVSAPASTGKWDQGGGFADDATLDGAYGNPAVFKAEPKEWDGPSQIGVKASDVPPDYGLLYAGMMDRFGDKAKRENSVDKNGKPVAWRKYQEAACFRSWAKRNQAKLPPRKGSMTITPRLFSAAYFSPFVPAW